MSPGGRGGVYAAGEEEIQDHVEIEEDSTGTVPILPARGTFIGVTADGTVTEARYSTNRYRAAENMSEDLLNRHIQDYGLVSPEKSCTVLLQEIRIQAAQSSR
jgi:hypothetical protein